MSVPPPASVAILARGVRATGWYLAGSILGFIGATLFAWAVPAVLAGPVVATVYFVGAATVLVGFVFQLMRYGREGDLDDSERVPLRRRVLWWPLGLVVGGAVLVGIVSSSAVPAGSFLLAGLCLVRWPRGVRVRGVLLLTAALWVLWLVEAADGSSPGIDALWPMLAVFSLALPPTVALSLWSWDIVLELDRARRTQARLAAVQERLRLADELHDLQGHHLQVIALQLELAERMLPVDPAAAATQIALARASVDDARAGTRELAGRFRGVPLPDELANAADLLRAAGLRVELDVPADTATAPATLLGPVVRECATNILKHGGGRWAELRLRPDSAGWELRIANDPGDAAAAGDGAGLAGIERRMSAAGGTAHTSSAPDRFEVVVTVPATVDEVVA